MAEDKRINVGVDDSGVNKLRQSASELARDMIRSSRAYSTSAKEVLKDLEDQIRAIEKRNKLDAEAARLSIQNRGAAGTITPDQQRSQLGQLARQAQEDKIQTQLLRELIDTVRATAREEIRENRVAVEQTISRDRNVTRLRPQGDAEEILRHTIQREMLGTVGEAETEERNKFRTYGKSVGAGVNQTLSTVAGSPNAFYMGAAALALIPVVGMGLSAVANKLVGSADRYERSGSKLAGLKGTDLRSEIDNVNEIGGAGYFSRFGLSSAAVAEKMYGYKRASGNRVGNLTSMQLMAMERTLDIDPSTMTGLASIQRYDDRKRWMAGGESIRIKGFDYDEFWRKEAEKLIPKSDTTARVNFSVEQRAEFDAKAAALGIDNNKEAREAEKIRKDKLRIEDTEVFKTKAQVETSGIRDAVAIMDKTSRGNHAVLQEMLGTFTNTSNQILAISGNIDMRGTAAAIHGISRSTGTEGKQLERFVGGVQGMGKSQNPVVRSMMLRAFRESNPNASFFEIQAMMENPLAHMDSMQKVFNQVKTATGGGDLEKQVQYNLMSGAVSKTDLLQGDTFAHINSETEKAKKIKPIDQTQKLPEIVGAVESSTAFMESLTQEVGEKVVRLLDEGFTKLAESFDSVFNSEDYVKRTQKAVTDGVVEGNKRSRSNGN